MTKMHREAGKASNVLWLSTGTSDQGLGLGTWVGVEGPGQGQARRPCHLPLLIVQRKSFRIVVLSRESAGHLKKNLRAHPQPGRASPAGPPPARASTRGREPPSLGSSCHLLQGRSPEPKTLNRLLQVTLGSLGFSEATEEASGSKPD